MSKLKIFIDLDDTLIDTAGFKGIVAKYFGELGYTDDQVADAYYKARGDKYTLELHLDELNKLSPNKHHRMHPGDIIEKIKKHLSSCLLPETKEFLEKINRDKFEIYLFSFGNPEFQKWKIEGTGIIRFFDPDKIYFITHEGKADEIHKIISRGEKFIMIDDKSTELEYAKKVFNDQVTVIQVSRGELLNHLEMINSCIK